jgi:RNA polymerase sigma-70 factor (ECF subfamily)
VRNLSIAARQKAARYQASANEVESLNEIPAPPSATAETGDLQIVLAHLPEEQREVLLLRFVEGLSLNEIAEAMNIPLGTVKSRIHNALETLRQDERTRNFFER